MLADALESLNSGGNIFMGIAADIKRRDGASIA